MHLNRLKKKIISPLNKARVKIKAIHQHRTKILIKTLQNLKKTKITPPQHSQIPTSLRKKSCPHIGKVRSFNKVEQMPAVTRKSCQFSLRPTVSSWSRSKLMKIKRREKRLKSKLKKAILKQFPTVVSRSNSWQYKQDSRNANPPNSAVLINRTILLPCCYSPRTTQHHYSRAIISSNSPNNNCNRVRRSSWWP